MKPSFIKQAGYVVLGLCLAGSLRAASVLEQTVEAGGEARHYLLSVTASAADEKRPLVILLHGHGGSARQVFGLTGKPSPLSVWRTIGQRENLLVAALDGKAGRDGQQGWNDCRADAPNNPNSDDVAFAQAVIEREIRERRADPQRIYLMGMSNGAMMAYRLGLELPVPVAALAAVSGGMAVDDECRRKPRGTAVMLMHGTADPLAPYHGGEVGFGKRKNRGKIQSMDSVLDYWVAANRLSPEPHLTAIPPKSAASRVMRKTWADPQGQARLVLVQVEGGGHVEPSIREPYSRFYERIVGIQNHDIESAEEAWMFFKPIAVP